MGGLTRARFVGVGETRRWLGLREVACTWTWAGDSHIAGLASSGWAGRGLGSVAWTWAREARVRYDARRLDAGLEKMHGWAGHVLRHMGLRGWTLDWT